MEDVMNSSMRIFETYTSHMTKTCQKEIWKHFLEQTVINYIQCLLNSTPNIKSQSGEAINKLNEDFSTISSEFEEYMNSKAIKRGIEVLEDLKNFFESSVDFLPISIDKMRRIHGPSFNLRTVKALLNLRSDLTKSEKN